MGRIRRYRTAWSRHHRSAGFGIHSPFAYRFVVDVLHERLPYYEYEYIEELRHAVIESTRHHWRHPRIISLKNAKMLFRITNFFNPKCILQIGTKYGISSASMFSVSSSSRLFLYEPGMGDYPVVARVLGPYMESLNCYYNLKVAQEEYRTVVSSEGNEPFVLVNDVPHDEDFEALRDFLLELMDRHEGVILMRNMCHKKEIKELFGLCKGHLVHGQTFTNEKMGIIIVSPKLQLEHFFLWF